MTIYLVSLIVFVSYILGPAVTQDPPPANIAFGTYTTPQCHTVDVNDPRGRKDAGEANTVAISQRRDFSLNLLKEIGMYNNVRLSYEEIINRKMAICWVETYRDKKNKNVLPNSSGYHTRYRSVSVIIDTDPESFLSKLERSSYFKNVEVVGEDRRMQIVSFYQRGDLHYPFLMSKLAKCATSLKFKKQMMKSSSFVDYERIQFRANPFRYDHRQFDGVRYGDSLGIIYRAEGSGEATSTGATIQSTTPTNPYNENNEATGTSTTDSSTAETATPLSRDTYATNSDDEEVTEEYASELTTGIYSSTSTESALDSTKEPTEQFINSKESSKMVNGSLEEDQDVKSDLNLNNHREKETNSVENNKEHTSKSINDESDQQVPDSSSAFMNTTLEDESNVDKKEFDASAERQLQKDQNAGGKMPRPPPEVDEPNQKTKKDKNEITPNTDGEDDNEDDANQKVPAASSSSVEYQSKEQTDIRKPSSMSKISSNGQKYQDSGDSFDSTISKESEQERTLSKDNSKDTNQEIPDSPSTTLETSSKNGSKRKKSYNDGSQISGNKRSKLHPDVNSQDIKGKSQEPKDKTSPEIQPQENKKKTTKTIPSLTSEEDEYIELQDSIQGLTSEEDDYIVSQDFIQSDMTSEEQNLAIKHSTNPEILNSSETDKSIGETKNKKYKQKNSGDENSTMRVKGIKMGKDPLLQLRPFTFKDGKNLEDGSVKKIHQHRNQEPQKEISNSDSYNGSQSSEKSTQEQDSIQQQSSEYLDTLENCSSEEDCSSPESKQPTKQNESFVVSFTLTISNPNDVEPFILNITNTANIVTENDPKQENNTERIKEYFGRAFRDLVKKVMKGRTSNHFSVFHINDKESETQKERKQKSHYDRSEESDVKDTIQRAREFSIRPSGASITHQNYLVRNPVQYPFFYHKPVTPIPVPQDRHAYILPSHRRLPPNFILPRKDNSKEEYEDY